MTIISPLALLLHAAKKTVARSFISRSNQQAIVFLAHQPPAISGKEYCRLHRTGFQMLSGTCFAKQHLFNTGRIDHQHQQERPFSKS